jgi:hypothetical protein
MNPLNLILIAVFTFSTSTQTSLNGRVVTEKGTPIAGASVFVYGGNCGGWEGVHVVTNHAGFYHATFPTVCKGVGVTSGSPDYRFSPLLHNFLFDTPRTAPMDDINFIKQSPTSPSDIP